MSETTKACIFGVAVAGKDVVYKFTRAKAALLRLSFFDERPSVEEVATRAVSLKGSDCFRFGKRADGGGSRWGLMVTLLLAKLQGSLIWGRILK